MTPAEAWSAVVAGEDAAVYAYSIAGARVAGAARTRALAGLDAHRAHRDRATALLVRAGGTPAPAPAAYALPIDPSRPRDARRLMALVDNRLVGVYADAAEAADGATRRWAARMAAEAATRAVAWGAEPQAFPTGGAVAGEDVTVEDVTGEDVTGEAGPTPAAG